ncbi:CPBP family intramembrane glutamic endopeptidase [Paenibacillus terrigena]|uniref:CPBP family intramembrane glutamic endopeptidase n=1 Tax=Paenibacillus terrigena TaxID=369333 RepID=UPI0028D1E5FB|nr:CPBP family intramembrane glutamic endopeptidase [Paenibacillus terrigena]
MKTVSNFFRFERENADFPFYDRQSSLLSIWGSVFIFVSIVVGFLLFSYGIGGPLQPFMNVIFPLAAFVLVVRGQWKLLFRKLVLKDTILIIGTVVVNIIVTFIVAAIVSKLFGTNPNQATEGPQPLSFFLKTIPMLFGEELISILPFLIILKISVQYLKLSRKKGVILAVILTALIFGAYHLPTYNWNIVQCILVIGTARVILLYPYLKTKNIWTSTIAHIMNDWFIFSLAFLGTILGH